MTPEMWWGYVGLSATIATVSFVIMIVIEARRGNLHQDQTINQVLQTIETPAALSAFLLFFWPMVLGCLSIQALIMSFAYLVRACVGGPWLEKRDAPKKEDFKII